MKLRRISIQFIDWISLRSFWNFHVGYFSSEVLKLTHSAHRLDQFAKQLSFSSKQFELWSFFEVEKSFKVLKLRFLNKLFQLWRFSIFPSCFLDEIFKFQVSYLSYEVLNLINSIHRLDQFAKRIEFFKQANWALKMTNSIHSLNRFEKIWVFQAS